MQTRWNTQQHDPQQCQIASVFPANKHSTSEIRHGPWQASSANLGQAKMYITRLVPILEQTTLYSSPYLCFPGRQGKTRILQPARPRLHCCLALQKLLQKATESPGKIETLIYRWRSRNSFPLRSALSLRDLEYLLHTSATLVFCLRPLKQSCPPPLMLVAMEASASLELSCMHFK